MFNNIKVEIAVDWQRMSPGAKSKIIKRVLLENKEEVKAFFNQGGSAETLADYLKENGLLLNTETLRRNVRILNLNPLSTTYKKESDDD